MRQISVFAEKRSDNDSSGIKRCQQDNPRNDKYGLHNGISVCSGHNFKLFKNAVNPADEMAALIFGRISDAVAPDSVFRTRQKFAG
jgi:hypothetical protein